jgi:D-amino-acid dehydrogenase
MTNNNDVLVIGAGIIGVCCAYYLHEMGFKVTVIDKGEIASGCSKENAGLIVPSLIVPLASPGALKYGLKTFLNPDSPFYIKPRINLGTISWISKFLRASQSAKIERNLRILHTLNSKSRALFEDIIEKEEISCDFQARGWLKVFTSEHGFKDGLKEAEMLREYGIEYHLLTHNELMEREPILSPVVTSGILFPGDAYLDPELFTRQLAKRLIEKGVVFKTGVQALDFEISDRMIRNVITSRGNFQADQIIVAAGAWSLQLADKLGRNVFIEAGKGYSFILENFPNPPSTALYLSEGKVAVTPLSGGLRLAGTMELGGFNEVINQRRVNAILNTAKKYLILPGEITPGKTWYGLRPCTPDGLPVIERDRYYKNLITATGHCMLGVTQAPVTGWHAAQIASFKSPEIVLHTIKSSRF